MRRLVLGLAAAVLLIPPPRGAAAGVLSGTLRSPDHQPLAQVVLVVEGAGVRRILVTGPDGGFAAEDLAPGDYRLRLDVPGFLLRPEPRVVVGNDVAGLDLVLQPAPLREQVLVAATRGDAPLSTLGTSATVLDEARIAERQAATFLDLLREVPGVSVTQAGGVGLQASAFVRGGESRYARILVDGVPVNQPGGLYDFGSTLPFELARVEIVRGAASSLYGTDALAGVIQLVTRRAAPAEAPGLRAEAEAGNFGWTRFLGGTSGRTGGFDWNAGVQRLDTDNEVPNSAFGETAGAAALGARLGERSDLRLLVRASDSRVGTPGQTAFGRPDLDASFERTDWTLGGQWRRSGERVAHEARVGFATSHQLSLDPQDSGSFVPRSGDRVGGFEVFDFVSAEGYQNDTSRLSLGYQAEARLGARHLLSAGADLERESGEIGARSEPLLSPSRTNAGAYAQDRVVLAESVYLTLGGRIEHNGSFGTRAVPRAAVAWRVRGGDDATTLRASGGGGIKEPTFLESFGVSFFARGNPGLKPERSRSFDLGLEQRLARGRLRAEATFFHHNYRDQIAYQVIDFTTFQGSYANLGETRAQGLELSLEAAPHERLRVSAQYTWLDTKILTSTSDFDPVYAAGKPLLRRPRHQGSLSLRWDGSRAGAGATLLLVGRRADSDFLGLGLDQNPGHARVDVRTRVRLVRGLEAFAVAENLLDRRYQEVLGYPALGRSLRAGLRFRSGR